MVGRLPENIHKIKECFLKGKMLEKHKDCDNKDLGSINLGETERNSSSESLETYGNGFLGLHQSRRN